MMRVNTVAVLALAFISLFAVANSELEIKAWMPDNPTLEFFPGKLGTTIIGVRNTGSQTYNITGPAANLALSFQPDMNVFNFTRMPYRGNSLGPLEEINMEYPLFFPSNMPAREFLLQMAVFFSQDGMHFQQQFYNQTITVIKPSTLLDAELLGLYLVGLVLLAAAGYGVMEVAKSKGLVKKSRKTRTATAAGTETKTEWLAGTVADPKKVKKSS